MKRARARRRRAKIDSDPPAAAGGRRRVARKNAAAGQKSARGAEGNVKDASPPADAPVSDFWPHFLLPDVFELDQ